MSNPTKLATEALALIPQADGNSAALATYANTYIPQLADAIDRQAKLLKKYREEHSIVHYYAIRNCRLSNDPCDLCREYDLLQQDK